MISIDGANAYFANRVAKQKWESYPIEMRKAAIEQSKQDFARALGRALREDEPSYRFEDRTRDDFACYEQALHELQLNCEREASEGDCVALSDDQHKHAVTLRCKWAPEALSWLGAPSCVQTSLG